MGYVARSQAGAYAMVTKDGCLDIEAMLCFVGVRRVGCVFPQ